MLVLAAACAFSLAPHVRLYAAQLQEESQLRRDIADDEAAIAALQDEQALWQDDVYVAAQARDRLHYVFPGETVYVVPPEVTAVDPVVGTSTDDPSTDPSVDPSSDSGTAPDLAVVQTEQPWYDRVWDRLAG